MIHSAADSTFNCSETQPVVYKHEMVLVQNPPLPQISGISIALTTLDTQLTNDVDISMNEASIGETMPASADCWHSNFGF